MACEALYASRMGWWKLGGSEGFVMGDQAADVMGVALQELAGFEVRPSMDELLDAFEEAVRKMPSDMLADSLGARSVRVVDWPERRHAPPAPALTEHLCAGFRRSRVRIRSTSGARLTSPSCSR